MVEGLTADWRLNIAYNAALQAATAALAASGYRAAREAHHLRVMKSLEFTIGLDKNTFELGALKEHKKHRRCGLQIPVSPARSRVSVSPRYTPAGDHSSMDV